MIPIHVHFFRIIENPIRTNERPSHARDRGRSSFSRVATSNIVNDILLFPFDLVPPHRAYRVVSHAAGTNTMNNNVYVAVHCPRKDRPNKHSFRKKTFFTNMRYRDDIIPSFDSAARNAFIDNFLISTLPPTTRYIKI